ncbi:glyoxalase domain-containing protein 4 [Coccinella septempunctata]|uniref:glyoxalase domain-containing protein 4 n=1 Tax=Coccinella septempunctata TaxID=41139 RepID=UPI001D06942E|nr:glyoxalase domain-containing protein 4 [Coccinella septempunctata]
MGVHGRALHFVFKVPDRAKTVKFYRDILGMKVLRHEEFSEGCEASCNGPYANRWSKTMIGYGPEDNHFVVELTYNYGIKSYEKGNDFISMTIKSREALERAKMENWPVLPDNTLEAPGGYKFRILDEPQPTNSDPVQKVTLSCSALLKSITFWNNILGLTIFERTDKTVLLGFKQEEAKLELVQSDEPINRAKAFGRIAFSCPHGEQEGLAKKVEENKVKVIHPLTVLPTPGKADVRVLIIADPDDHEICFVDDEGFRELSKVDPEANKLVERYIKTDKS